MPEPKRISDRQIAALHAIAEAIESVARAYTEWANRLEAKETGPEVGISDEKPSAVGDCGSCAACDPGLILDGKPTGFPSRMSVCPDCGNKRCPKAANHATWQCSRSNETGQQGVPVPAERTQGESGGSRSLGELLRALTAGPHPDVLLVRVGKGEWDRIAAEADELEAAYRVADAEIARLSEFHDHYRAQVGRVWTLYNDTCARTKDGCSDDLENFLADLRAALDGPEIEAKGASDA